MQLVGRVAIVTGGSRGIGRAVAIGMAAEGASIVVVGRERAVADSVVDEIARVHGPERALAVAADVSVSAQTRRMVDITLERFGRVDVLVAGAAIINPTRFMEISEENWDRTLDVNLKGTFLSIQAVLPHMLERGSGKIITNTSLRTLRTVGGTDYAVSKAGVIALTQVLARELRSTGSRVNVNCVSPVAETRMSEALAASRGQTMEQFRTLRPGKLLSPGDTVSTYVFLASDASDYITGQVIAVDDGGSI